MLKQKWILAALGLCVVAVVVWKSLPSSRPELHILCWTGYDEPQLLRPFEQKYGVKVVYKTFVGGDAMFALLTQSRGQYDVVVVDPEYIEKLHSLDRLAPLDPKDFNLADYVPPFDKFPLAWIGGKMYAIPVEFGANALVYNTEHITADEAKSYDVLFSPKVKGKVSVWDWYLPIMGVVSLSAGNTKPYDISDEQFQTLTGRLMKLRPQMASIAGTFPELTASLSSGDTWVVPGGAGWLVTPLQKQGKTYDWTVPKEGGIMWMDSLAIPVDAPHPDLAKQYVQWMMTPEAQALLAGKDAFNATVPNAKAYGLMPQSLKDGLKTHNGDEAAALAEKLSVRSLPVQQNEKRWQNAWENFKAGVK